jgi:hypothetical protein
MARVLSDLLKKKKEKKNVKNPVQANRKPSKRKIVAPSVFQFDASHTLFSSKTEKCAEKVKNRERQSCFQEKKRQKKKDEQKKVIKKQKTVIEKQAKKIEKLTQMLKKKGKSA